MRPHEVIHEVFHDEELLAWDWRATLAADERGIPWLARQTRRSQSTVYAYAYGYRRTPVEWLREAARVLGWKGL
jgi:hypothetical protein